MEEIIREKINVIANNLNINDVYFKEYLFNNVDKESNNIDEALDLAVSYYFEGAYENTYEDDYDDNYIDNNNLPMDDNNNLPSPFSSQFPPLLNQNPFTRGRVSSLPRNGYMIIGNDRDGIVYRGSLSNNNFYNMMNEILHS